MRQLVDFQNKVFTDIEFRKYRYIRTLNSIIEDNLFGKLQKEEMVVTLICNFFGSISDNCSRKKEYFIF